MTWVQTQSGVAFDLVRPSPDMVKAGDIVESLARTRRFAGHAGSYTVAEHTNIGCDEIGIDAKAHWLLHDAHEAYIGDIVSPVVEAIAAHAADLAEEGIGIHILASIPVDIRRKIAATLVKGAVQRLKCRVDAAVHAHFGLAWPPPPAVALEIKQMDAALLMTERRDLLPPAPQPWANETAPLWRCRIKPQAWPKPAEGMTARLGQYLPQQRSAA